MSILLGLGAELYEKRKERRKKRRQKAAAGQPPTCSAINPFFAAFLAIFNNE